MQALLIAEKLRIQAGCPDVPLIIDVQFHHDGTAAAHAGESYFSDDLGAVDENVLIGPFVVNTRDEITEVYHDLQREICFGLGIPRILDTKLDLASAMSKYLGSA